jgi:endoglucanase
MKRTALLAALAFLVAACAAPAIQTTPPLTLATNVPLQTPTLVSTPSPTLDVNSCDLLPTPTSDHDTAGDIFTANRRLGRTINLAEAFELQENDSFVRRRVIQKEETFYMVRTAGFTAVRIATDFGLNSTSYPPYAIEPTYWEALDRAVQLAIKCQLVVILEMAWFAGDPRLQPKNEQHFHALWDQIAQHYTHFPDDKLYFELLSEPDTVEYWNELLAKGVAAIRRTNPLRPIIIDSVGARGSLRLPPDPNLIVAFYYYKPYPFTHQCADWFPHAMEWCGTTWMGTPDELAAIDWSFEPMARWLVYGRPVFLKEFGTWSSADADSRVRWTTAVRKAAEVHGFSWGYYTLCALDQPAFGILDCQDHPLKEADWNRSLLQALIPIRPSLGPTEIPRERAVP